MYLFTIIVSVSKEAVDSDPPVEIHVHHISPQKMDSLIPASDTTLIKMDNAVLPSISNHQTYPTSDRVDWNCIATVAPSQDEINSIAPYSIATLQNNQGADIYVRMESEGQTRQQQHQLHQQQHPTSVANDIVISYPDDGGGDEEDDVEYYFDGTHYPAANVVTNNPVASINYLANQHQLPPRHTSIMNTDNRPEPLTENEEARNVAIAAMTELQYKFLKIHNPGATTDEYQHTQMKTNPNESYYIPAPLPPQSISRETDQHSYLRSTLTSAIPPPAPFQPYNHNQPVTSMYPSRENTPSSQHSMIHPHVSNQQTQLHTNIPMSVEPSPVSVIQNYHTVLDLPVSKHTPHMSFVGSEVYDQHTGAPIATEYNRVGHYENETYVAAEAIHGIDQSNMALVAVVAEEPAIEQQRMQSILPPKPRAKRAVKDKIKTPRKIKKAAADDANPVPDTSHLHSCDLCEQTFEELADYTKHMESHIPGECLNTCNTYIWMSK